MAKLILEVQTSLDGYMAGPEGQVNWMIWNWGPEWTWDKELQNFHTDLTLSGCHILISRQMAEEGFIAHWQQTSVLNEEQKVFARHISESPKTIISRTLTKEKQIPGGWEGVAISGDLALSVSRLKHDTHGNILVYGGAMLVSSLLELDLIDELYLLVNPVAIGRGMHVFPDSRAFILRDAKSYRCSLVVLHYECIQRDTSGRG